MIRLSGLWKNTTNDGKVYYAGKINNDVRILIFPNRHKTSDAQPDFEVFLEGPRQNTQQSKSEQKEQEL